MGTFELAQLTITHTPEFVSLHDAATVGGNRSSGIADVFRVTGKNIDADVYYIEWVNGEREVQLGSTRTAPASITLAMKRRRLEIPTRYVLKRDSTRFWYVCLRQARIKNEQGWCGLYSATLDELDEGSGTSVKSVLLSLGADNVDTQEQLWQETNRSRFLCAAMFLPENKEVPVAAFVLTRILPLLNGVKAIEEG